MKICSLASIIIRSAVFFVSRSVVVISSHPRRDRSIRVVASTQSDSKHIIDSKRPCDNEILQTSAQCYSASSAFSARVNLVRLHRICRPCHLIEYIAKKL